MVQVARGLFPRHPLSFNYMVIQIDDDPSADLVHYFPKCFEFIDSAINKGGGSVLTVLTLSAGCTSTSTNTSSAAGPEASYLLAISLCLSYLLSMKSINA